VENLLKSSFLLLNDTIGYSDNTSKCCKYDAIPTTCQYVTGKKSWDSAKPFEAQILQYCPVQWSPLSEKALLCWQVSCHHQLVLWQHSDEEEYGVMV